MSQSSILGGERAPQQAKGRNADTLGPSDTSDSGSDIQGASRLKTDAEEGELGGATPVGTDSDTDSMGTGERAEAVPGRARRRRHRPRPDRPLEGRARLGRVDHGDDDAESIEGLADRRLGRRRERRRADALGVDEPARSALATACARDCACSLAMIWATWNLAVCAEMPSAPPISRLPRPWLIAASTWRSRGVSASKPGGTLRRSPTRS